MSESALELRYNIAALTIAICYQDYLLPEAAFGILEGKSFKITDKDKEDMLRLRIEGETYREIGKMYGLTESNTFKILKRYKEKKTLSDGGLNKVNG